MTRLFPAPETITLPLYLCDRTFRVPYFACKLLPERDFRPRISTCPPRSAILAAPAREALRHASLGLLWLDTALASRGARAGRHALPGAAPAPGARDAWDGWSRCPRRPHRSRSRPRSRSPIPLGPSSPVEAAPRPFGPPSTPLRSRVTRRSPPGEGTRRSRPRMTRLFPAPETITLPLYLGDRTFVYADPGCKPRSM